MTIWNKIKPIILDAGDDRVYLSDDVYDYFIKTEWMDYYGHENDYVRFVGDKNCYFFYNYDGTDILCVIPKKPAVRDLPYSL